MIAGSLHALWPGLLWMAFHLGSWWRSSHRPRLVPWLLLNFVGFCLLFGLYTRMGAARGIALHQTLTRVQWVLQHPDALRNVLKARLAEAPNDLRALKLLQRIQRQPRPSPRS